MLIFFEDWFLIKMINTSTIRKAKRDQHVKGEERTDFVAAVILLIYVSQFWF